MSSDCPVAAARRAKLRDLIIKIVKNSIFRCSSESPSQCMEDLLGSFLLMNMNQNELTFHCKFVISHFHTPDGRQPGTSARPNMESRRFGIKLQDHRRKQVKLCL